MDCASLPDMFSVKAERAKVFYATNFIVISIQQKRKTILQLPPVFPCGACSQFVQIGAKGCDETKSVKFSKSCSEYHRNRNYDQPGQKKKCST